MPIDLLLALLGVSVLGGLLATRIWARRRQKNLIARRLMRWAETGLAHKWPVDLLKAPDLAASSGAVKLLRVAPSVEAVQSLLTEAGYEGSFPQFAAVTFSLLIFPPLIAFAFGFELAGSALAGVLLAFVPLAYLKWRAVARRTKFSEQLPDAIDLMVSVLRSGHSIPQAVKAVAEEVSSPCGLEFDAILRRMNLGQPLPEAMSNSSQRFRSYELDLIRRAVSIQAEVGGSLAELLEKTNITLRQRLKLVRQVRVVTAQSRLTALIVGLLPFFLAIMLNIMSPGYLQPLLEEGLGRTLLILALSLQVIGLLIMKRLSTMRV